MKYKIKLYNGKTINLNIKNNLTKIYGSNGVGKTTISTFFSKKEKCLVFNENYVFQNIYSVDENVKSTVDQKKKTGRNFISNEYKVLHEQVQFLADNIRENKKKIDNAVESFKKIILNDKKNKNIINSFIFELENFYKKWESKILNKLEGNLKFTEISKINNKSIYLEINALLNQEFIKNQEQLIMKDFNSQKLEKNISDIKYNDLINRYNKLLDVVNYNELKLLTSYFNLFKKYNDLLKEKNKFDDALRTIFNIFGSLNESIKNNIDAREKLLKWVDEGKKLHESFEIDKENYICLYCGNKDINFALLEAYKLIFEDRALKNSNKLIDEIKKINIEYKKIYSEFKLDKNYKNIKDNKVQEVLKKISNIFDNKLFEAYIKKISNKETITEVEINSLVLNLEKINIESFDKNNLFLYVLKENLEIIVKNLEPAMYEKISKHIVNELEKKMNNEIKKIEKRLNNLMLELNNLQLNPFDFEVKFEKSRGNTKNKEAEMKIVNRTTKEEIIGQLSTGQRNNLALMYFIAVAKEKIDSNEVEIIVVDDPVDGGDFYSYFLMKSFIINYFSDKENIKLIILTHNFDYLLIQMASTDRLNPVTSQPIKNHIDILKITNDGCIIDLKKEEINADDKSIYFNLTKKISEKKDNSLFLVATWVIWTRKILEVILAEDIKINTGEYIPDYDQYKFIIKRLSNSNQQFEEKLNNYFSNIYINFIKGKMTYENIILETKKIIMELFNNGYSIKELYNLINQFNDNDSFYNETFKIEDYLINSDENSDFLVKIASESAKIMIYKHIFSFKKSQKSKKNKIIEDISNYLKHSGNSVSRPIIALEINSILNNLKDDFNKEKN